MSQDYTRKEHGLTESNVSSDTTSDLTPLAASDTYINIREYWDHCLVVQHGYSSATHKLTTELLRELTKKTIPLIGHRVIIDKEITTLEWNHFETFVLSFLELTDPLNDFIHSHMLLALLDEVVDDKKSDDQSTILFNTTQSAMAFKKFLDHILPITLPNYPSIEENTITISSDQHFFLMRTAMLGEKGLTNSFIHNYYLKTLRADAFDFSSSFLWTLFKTDENNRAFQNLRPKNRGHYIVNPDGKILERREKKTDPLKPRSEYTQIQSVTYIDEYGLSSAFGFGLRETLYGLMTHQQDLIIKQFLVKDVGTVGRPFESRDLEQLHQYAVRLKTHNNRTQYLPSEHEQFKTANMLARVVDSKTNETLARIRFNPHRSVVSVCADSLGSRLLALDFSEELFENYTQSMAEKGQRANHNFKLPVIIYLKSEKKDKPFYSKIVRTANTHQLSLYTTAMRHKDIEQCHAIFKNKTKRLEQYKLLNFEFLLGLHELTANIFLEQVDGIPIALFMLRSGHARMLMRLLRPSRLAKMSDTPIGLLNDIFDTLLKNSRINKNDPIISELIVIEAFELANKIIKETQSEKKELKFRDTLLTTHLSYRGNPRQLEFMGLNEMLQDAAKNKNWVTIRLCLKEIGTIDQTVLDELLYHAVNDRQYSEIILLLKLGAGKDFEMNIQIRSILSNKNINWSLIELFLHHHKSPSMLPEFGRAFVVALKNKKFKLARQLAEVTKSQEWREIRDTRYQFRSALFYVVKYNIHDLLEKTYTDESNYNDENTTARISLAYDLAIVQNNTTAKEFLQNKTATNSLFIPRDPLASVCRLVLEAYFLGEKELAEWRLFHYGHEHKLLPPDCHDIIEALKSIQQGYSKALSTMYEQTSTEPYMGLGKIFLFYYNVDIYREVKNAFDDYTSESLSTEKLMCLEILYGYALEHVDSIKIVISQSLYKNIWLQGLSLMISQFFPEEAYQSKAARKTKLLRTESYIAIFLYTLEIIANEHLSNPIDKLEIKNIEHIIQCVLILCFQIKNEKAAHALLDNTVFSSEKIKEIFLRDMINCFNSLKLDESIGETLENAFENDSKHIASYFKQHTFVVRKEHLDLAKKTRKWRLPPLLEAMNTEEFHNPDYFWDFFVYWKEFKFCSHNYPKACSEILEAKLGPIHTLHYTLLYSIAILYHKFMVFQDFWSHTHLKRFVDSKPTREIVLDSEFDPLVQTTLDDNFDSIRIPLFKILDDYLSQLPSFDTIPDTKTLIETFKNLLSTVESALPTLSFNFFRAYTRQTLTADLHNLLLEAKPQLDQIKSNHTQQFGLAHE